MGNSRLSAKQRHHAGTPVRERKLALSLPLTPSCVVVVVPSHTAEFLVTVSRHTFSSPSGSYTICPRRPVVGAYLSTLSWPRRSSLPIAVSYFSDLDRR